MSGLFGICIADHLIADHCIPLLLTSSFLLFADLKLARLPARSLLPSSLYLLFRASCTLNSSFFLDTFTRRFLREALAHRNHSGGTGGFSGKTRRDFLSGEADYRLDLQETRRLLRRDDGFAQRIAR